MSQTETSLSRNKIFDLLGNKRRRFILTYLREEEQSVELSRIVEEVAAWENEKPVEELTEDERRRVYVSLYQNHIPKLAAADLINYDDDDRSVELADRASQIESYFHSENSEPNWYLYYLLVAFFGISVFATSLLVPEWMNEVENTLLPAIILVLVMLAVVHFVYGRLKKKRRVQLVDETRR